MNPAARRGGRRGSALLIVLAMLLLLTPLVLALFFRTRSSLTSSNHYANGASAHLLAQTALDLVISQIRSGSSNLHQAWISQPGLIRTYDNTGRPVAAYKLYSSDRMTVAGAFDPVADTRALTGDDWADQPNLYTDLNSPVLVSGTPVFPILDGNNLQLLPVGNKSLLTYDAMSPGTPDIEGFGIDPDDAGYKVAYTAGSAVTAANTPVPMPVKWLYVLKDGTLLSATASGGGRDVTVGGNDLAPTTANPIVARIAFWTDDESAKLNLNTAGEGTFWDTPVGATQPPGGPGGYAPANAYDPANVFEYDLAARPPVTGEYQAVPGHPGTTSLSPVFGAALRSYLGLPAGNTSLTGSARARFVQAIDAVSPLYSDAGSSQGGTRVTDAVGAVAGSPVAAKDNPFYATPDEVFYQSSSSTRQAQQLTSAANLPILVAESRFFLTTTSSAPEVNVFNKPRVAIWPVPAAANGRTAFDQKVALCSTVGSNGGSPEPFYFTRQDPASPTADWLARNASVYAYLTGLAATAWPGYGGTLASKYGADCDQILTEIFDYIRCTNLVDPTLGASPYTSRAGADGSSASPAQGQVVPITPPNGTRGLGRIATISDLALVADKIDNRWVTSPDPADQPETTEENAVIDKDQVSGAPLKPKRPNYAGNPHKLTVDYTTQTEVEFALVPQLFNPAAGYPAVANDLKIVFSRFNLKVTAEGVTQTLFDQETQPALYDVGRVPLSSNAKTTSNAALFGGWMGPWALTGTPPAGTAASPTDSNVPTCIRNLAGLPGNVSYVDPDTGKAATPGTMIIEGSVHVDLYAPHNGPLAQSFDFTFPPTTVPIPGLPEAKPSGATAYTSGGTFGSYPMPVVAHATSTGRGTNGLHYRWPNGDCPIFGRKSQYIQYGSDVIRALEPWGVQGDLRLISASAMPTAAYPNLYQPPSGSGYYTSLNGHLTPTDYTGYMAHDFYSFMPRPANQYYGATFGSLVRGLAADIDNLQQYPALPDTVNGVTNYLGQPGDWDNGPGLLPDGPYINKSDEGAGLNTITTPTVPYIGDKFYLVANGAPDPAQIDLFNPARQVPSPVMFGSLPTGVLARHPWQTLLFRPAKSYLPGGTAHPGAASPNPQDGTASYPPYTAPPDHCLLDLFWMPTVDPAPISRPFATSGKVNLNYQIAPFTYIKRSTAMRGVLKAVEVTALNPAQACPSAASGNASASTLYKTYKMGGVYGVGNANVNWGGGAGVSVRRPVDADRTLQQFDELYFAQNHPFITESQICDVPLIPADKAGAGYVNAAIPSGAPASGFDTYLATFWKAHNLTGDNSLERPYAAIYPRVTTKSNVYTVHVRVQTLRKAHGGSAAVFRNGVDQVTGEFRGSFVVERYLDPNAAGFYEDGHAVAGGSPELDANAVLGPYKFRILNTQQFAP